MQVGADSVMPFLDNDCLMRVELQLAALALGARKVLCQWGRAREASGVCAHRAHVRRRIVLKTTTLSVAQFSTQMPCVWRDCSAQWTSAAQPTSIVV